MIKEKENPLSYGNRLDEKRNKERRIYEKAIKV